MEFGSSKKMLTGSMTDNFGPGNKGSQPGSFLSPDKVPQNQASVEENDEPEMDLPDERPIKNATMK